MKKLQIKYYLFLYFEKATCRLISVGAFIFLLLPSVGQAQQFFNYNQYKNNITPFNPAYSLLDKNGSLGTSLKKQWTGIQGAPSTFIFNSSFPIEPIGSAAGVFVLNDQLAVESMTEVDAFFAKSVELSDGDYLGVSLNAGVKRYSADYSSLDANDPAFRNNVRENNVNIGFGVMLYSDNYYVGVSVPESNITSLGQASSKDNNYFRSHFNFSGACLLGNYAQNFRFKPAFLAVYTKGEPFVANLSGVLYIKNTFGIGGNYRSNKEMAGLISIVLSSFKFGYSYQLSVARGFSSTFSNAIHEITLSYRFGNHLGDINLL